MCQILLVHKAADVQATEICEGNVLSDSRNSGLAKYTYEISLTSDGGSLSADSALPSCST